MIDAKTKGQLRHISGTMGLQLIFVTFDQFIENPCDKDLHFGIN